MPGPVRLEKMKKKFYKTNVDRDFDVDFVPGTANAG
jgi:hypothetical protein